MAIPKLKLNSGAQIPAIGFGTWQLSPDEAISSVGEALKIGYRLIDTAKIYHNEEAVGQAIKQSGVARQEIFLTTKLWQGDLGYDSAHKAFDDSLERLGLDYVDLYLIHWPGDDIQKRADAWTALSEIQKTGRAKAIGVSNYTVRHLKALLEDSDTKPALNQVEFHPFMYQEQTELLEFCKSNDILFEAYSPLARGRHQDGLLNQIGQNYGKSASQVMLRWAIQHRTIPLPRSSQPAHIRENFEVFDFELSTQDMDSLDQIDQSGRTSWDPTGLP